MSELERALRGAFALDAVPTPAPGFEARMARAAGGRGRMRAAPVVLAALVAGAAAATLAIVRGGDQPPAAPRLAMRPTAAPATVRPGGGSTSITEVWQLVIRFQRSFSLSVDHDHGTDDGEESIDREAMDDEQPPPPAPHERRRRHRAAQPSIDCGNDPLCPLVAPNAARLRVATRGGGWGRVYIDGQDAGATPLDIEVIPGRHRLVVLDGNGQTRTLAIDLEPGERRSMVVTMPRPPRHPDPR